MLGPINCTGTLCIYPMTFIHLLLQPGNLVSKDFLSFSLPRKFTTEGLTSPHHCKTGMSFFLSSPSQNIEVWKPIWRIVVHVLCQCFYLFTTLKAEETRKRKTFTASINRNMSSLHQAPNVTYTGTTWTLRRNFVCILHFEAIISRMGKNTAVCFLWFLFCGFSLGFHGHKNAHGHTRSRTEW